MPMSSEHDRTTVSVDVTFNPDGEPSQIEYFHADFGMMKLEVKDGVAALDPEWDRLHDGSLKDDFTRWVTTGDVLRSVEQLPFIEQIEVFNSDR